MNSKIKIELGYIRQLVLRLLLVLFVFSLSRMCFYCFNKASFPEIEWGSFASIFLHGTRFDLSAIIYVNSLLLISYLLPFSFRENRNYKKIQKIIFLITNAIALAFEITDIGFFKFAVRRSIGSDMSMVLSTADLAPKYLLEHWYLLLLFAAFILLLNYLFNITTIDTRGKKNIFSQLFLFLFGVAILIIGSRGGLQPRPIMPITAAEFVEDIRLVPLISNTSLGLIFSSQQRFIKNKNYFSEKELDQQFSLIQKPKPKTPFKKENIFIIVLESFGKEAISFYNPKANTPFLDSLIKQSLSFNNSFANGLRSTQGIVAITAGIPALMEDPLMFSVYQSNQINGIATLLEKENYTSAFFHGANPGSMEFGHFSKLAGFDYYLDRTQYPDQNDHDGNWGIWDFPFFQFTVNKVNTFEKPFFTMLFSLTSHHPYHVEKWFEDKYPAMDIIDRSTLYADYALQQFFETAKKMPWFENTLFIITGDHTGVRRTGKYKTRVNNYAVPILFYKADTSFVKVSNRLVSQIDILPTVMDHLNYNKPFTSFGASVFDSLSQNYTYMLSEGIYQILDKEYVLFFDEQKTLALYNYQLDPALENDLSIAQANIKTRLEQKIKAVIQRHNKAMISNQLTVK